MKNSRKSHEELILRFIALYFDLDNYKAPMKHFLNIYMNKNRHFKFTKQPLIEEIFNKTMDICDKFLSKENICLLGSNRVNTQLLDSIFVGIANNIENPKLNQDTFLVKQINLLKEKINNEKYEFKQYWESRMSSDEHVRGRCKITTELFGE
jgi:hypothetical protein